jgi:RsiW-degrading membrane proteinase PrsW (M82 family)
MDATTVALLVVLISIAPAVFLLWYFYMRDKWDREPLILVLGVFAGGCVVAGIVYAIAYQDVTSTLLNFLQPGGELGLEWIRASLYIGIFGQLLLWGVVRFGVYNRKQFNEPDDGIVYGAAAGLGFAVVQNIILFQYVLTLPNPVLIGGWLVTTGEVNFATQVFLPTLLFTVPLQALFTAISCYCLGIAKFTPPGKSRNFTIFAGLLVAVLMQIGWTSSLLALFPSLINSYGLFLFYFDTICFAVAAWVLVTGRMDAALDRSPYNPSRRAPRPTTSLVSRITSAPNPVRSVQGRLSRFCPRCGTRITGATRFCPNCGTPLSGNPG